MALSRRQPTPGRIRPRIARDPVDRTGLREPGLRLVRPRQEASKLGDQVSHEAADERDAWLDAMVQVQENERRRVARELHDAVGQALTVIRLDLRSLQGRLGDDDVLAGSIAIVDLAMDEIRRIAADLRPAVLDDLGLVPALRSALRSHADTAGFQGRFSASRLPALSASVATVCFRIAQEALTNVARHADATNVAVLVTVRGDHLLLTVHDDGRGFDAVHISQRPIGERLGLVGMQERARLVGGTLEIRSLAGHGALVRARLPLRSPSGRTAS